MEAFVIKEMLTHSFELYKKKALSGAGDRSYETTPVILKGYMVEKQQMVLTISGEAVLTTAMIFFGPVDINKVASGDLIKDTATGYKTPVKNLSYYRGPKDVLSYGVVYV